jgi:hypothetical protein
MRVTARLRATGARLYATYLGEDPVLRRGVLLYALTQLASIGWDLPCMYGWENDGVAPRDLFGGLAFNLTPGQGHRYPLFHYLLLALTTWPVVLVAALRARSWQLPDLMVSVLSAPVLSAIALIARVLAVAMGCMTVLAVARLGRRTVSLAAGRWVAAFAMLNLSLSYYGRVSNVDGPSLMWVALSLDRWLDITDSAHERDYRGFALCAAAALATKDQAYGVYALSAPLYLLALPALRAWPVSRPVHWRRLGIATLVGGVGYGLMSGALLNPTGFVFRLRLLTGGNSQDWRRYAHGAAGVWANIVDLAGSQAEFFWSWPVIVLAWGGALASWLRPSGASAFVSRARLLPLTCAISSLLTFTLVAARSDHRFVLPLGLALSYYAGIAAAHLVETLPRLARYALIVVLLLPAAGRSLALHLTQWGDGRRQVRQWLAQLPSGSRVETYGLGVYLPNFDRSESSTYRVQRVAPAPPPSRRPPLPGVLEIQDAYGNVAARKPDVLVVSEGFATRFLPEQPNAGHITSPETNRALADLDAQRFFDAALHNHLSGYRLAFVAGTHWPHWAQRLGLTPVHIHGSTAGLTWVLTRESSGLIESAARTKKKIGIQRSDCAVQRKRS